MIIQVDSEESKRDTEIEDARRNSNASSIVLRQDGCHFVSPGTDFSEFVDSDYNIIREDGEIRAATIDKILEKVIRKKPVLA